MSSRTTFAPLSDRRAGLLLGAPAVGVVLIIVSMLVFVAIQAWPSFQHNGLSLFGFDDQAAERLGSMTEGAQTNSPPPEAYKVGLGTLIYGTALVTFISVAVSTVVAILAAIFIVELAPEWIRRVVVPTVRLLAAVPSVIYGLIGILVLVPFFRENFITESQRESVIQVIRIDGSGVLVSVILLTLMISPIMIALIVDALETVPRGWREGALALGVTVWRATLSVSIKAIRPAIIAAAVLATARALGEAIMLAMVSGANFFAPQPWDGYVFLFEPIKPLASTIAESVENINSPALHSTLYAMALILLVSSFAFSSGSYFIRRRLSRNIAR